MPGKGLEDIPEPYKTVIKEVLKALRKVFGDKLISVVLYGSVARGDMRKDSDIDLLIVVEGLPKSRFRRQDLFEKVYREVEPLLDKLVDEGYYIAISPVMKTPEEASRFSPLYIDMVEDAIILYDKNNFMRNVLDRVRRKLRELGARRVWLGRRWYWILKEPYKFGEVIEFE